MPEITEAKLYEAFGLNPPAEDTGAGAQVQEPAAPAAEVPPASDDEGAKAQESAEPAAEDANQEPDGHSEPTAETAENNDADAGQGSKNDPLTLEQRRENAARRRQQEQQAAVDQAVAAARQEEQTKYADAMKEFFAQMGMKNTTTGQPITTMEEFYAWKSEHDAQQLSKDLKAGKLTPEQLNQVISNHPAIKRAERATVQAEQAQAQQQQAADRERIEGEIAEIGKLDPSIKGVPDLLKMPKAQQFREYVNKGYSFLDAFRLANFDSLTAKKAEAARQQAMNNQRGKDHLHAAGNPRGGGAVSVPASDLALFRAFNPKATEAEIQAYYNKFLKED